MQITRSMIDSHPRKQADPDINSMVACIETCHECEISCTSCADACLGEQNVQSLIHCIRLNQDCADVCAASGRLLGRQTESSWSLVAVQVDAMELACRLCAEECERHAQHHEHCRICAESCRKCEQACHRVMQALSAASA